MTSNLTQMRWEIAGKLNAAGVETSTNPNVQVPGVLVGSPSVLGTEGIGGWRVEYPIQIMGTPPGNEESLNWMLDVLEAVLIVFPGSASPRTIDHLGGEVPCYVVTVSKLVSNPNC